MNNFSHVPPGFRFHPTDEELVDYYLRKKVASKRIDLDIIKDVDLYKIEPWDLQELCKIGTDDENEWYFFSHKDKKYPTGTRTNRATKAGFWKATGRDKPIYSQHCLIGMRKTLVFYKGRAPNGQKSDWIMHEYRLEANENGTSQEEGWVVCKVFKKRMPTLMRKVDESSCWYEYDEQVSFMQQELESPSRVSHSHPYPHASYPFNCKQELELQYNNIIPHDAFLQQLPQLESPKVPQQQHCQQQSMQLLYGNNIDQAVDQLTDWRVLDKFVASQLSHDDHASKETSCYSNVAEQTALLANIESTKSETGGQEYAASTSNSSCQIDPWK